MGLGLSPEEQARVSNFAGLALGDPVAEVNLFEVYIEILGCIARWKRNGDGSAPLEQLRREFSSKGPEYFAMRQDAASRAEWTRLVALVDAARCQVFGADNLSNSNEGNKDISNDQKEVNNNKSNTTAVYATSEISDSASRELQGFVGANGKGIATNKGKKGARNAQGSNEAERAFFAVWDRFRVGVEAVQKMQDPGDLKKLMERSLCGLFSPRNKGHASKLLAKARDKHQILAAASSISAIAASKLAAEYRSVSDTILKSGSHLQVGISGKSPLVRKLVADGFRTAGSNGSLGNSATTSSTNQENALGAGNRETRTSGATTRTRSRQRSAAQIAAEEAAGVVSNDIHGAVATKNASRNLMALAHGDQGSTSSDEDAPILEELDIDASERATLELLSSLAQFKSGRVLLTPRRAVLTPRSTLTMVTANQNKGDALAVAAAMAASDDVAAANESTLGQTRRRRRAAAAAQAINAESRNSSETELSDGNHTKTEDAGSEGSVTICSVCAKTIEEKDFPDAVGCDFSCCSKWFHRRCVSFEGGEHVPLPEPWFCHACIAPTIKHLEKVHQQSRSKGSRRSLTHLLPNAYSETFGAPDFGSGVHHMNYFNQTIPGTGATNDPVAAATAAANAVEAAAQASTVQPRTGKRRSSISSNLSSSSALASASGQGPKPRSPKRRKYEFKNELALKRNPHQTTIVDLVEHGYLKPGDTISVPYLNKHRFEGVINNDGLIEFENNVFISPPSFALYCKRKIYKNKQSDRGWTSCFHGDTPLLHYRNQFLKVGKPT